MKLKYKGNVFQFKNIENQKLFYEDPETFFEAKLPIKLPIEKKPVKPK